MKTLLGIIASPRKNGNSELFVKEVYRHMPEDWSLRLLRLQDLDIRPCRACYRCLFGDMRCVQKDDFSFVLDSIVDCDAMVVAAPTYLLSANATLKLLLDRGLSFYGRMDSLWQKPAVGVAIAGIEGMEGFAKLMVESFIRLMFADLRDSEVIYGALPGEILLAEEAKEVAARFAKALVSPLSSETTYERDSAAPICPVCGGDTFRFLDESRLRCMLCSSEGNYKWEDGKLVVTTVASEHMYFKSLEDARKHLEWLRGMKEKFLARRDELKQVAREYLNEGVWVRPPKQGQEG